MDSSLKNFPKTLYNKLKDETCYKCGGTCCTCRFLKDRSFYDQMQFQIYQQGAKINLPYLTNPDLENQWKA